LILLAYQVDALRVDGLPDWAQTARFDVNVKASAPVTPTEMRALLRQLLADRFGLRAHVEARERPIDSLVMARGDRRLGPQMQPSKVDCTGFADGTRPASEAPRTTDGRSLLCDAVAIRTDTGVQSLLRTRSFCLSGSPDDCAVFKGTTMASLVSTLQQRVNRVVRDETGLTGFYDIELRWARDGMSAGVVAEGPSLFTALQEQLGLKLESGRAPVDVLVIDRVEPPVPD